MDARDALIYLQQEYIRELEGYGKYYNKFISDLPYLRVLVNDSETRDKCLRKIRESPYPAVLPECLFMSLMELPTQFLPELIKESLIYARVHGSWREGLTDDQKEQILHYIPSERWFHDMLTGPNAGHVNLYDLHKYIGHPKCVYQKFCTHTNDREAYCDICCAQIPVYNYHRGAVTEYYVPESYFQPVRDGNTMLVRCIPYWERKNAYIREHGIELVHDTRL